MYYRLQRFYTNSLTAAHTEMVMSFTGVTEILYCIWFIFAANYVYCVFLYSYIFSNYLMNKDVG